MKLIAGAICALSLMAIEKKAPEPEPGPPATLLTIQRVYVDKLGGGESAERMRDMIISSLLAAKVFAITENEERADAFLRGSSDDQTFTDEHIMSDSINANVRGGSSSSSRGGSYGNSSSKQSGLSIGENEHSQIAERKHEASAAVRLVNKDGDVLWSTTQESFGAKFKGSSADVADKIMRRLMEDLQKARAGDRR